MQQPKFLIDVLLSRAGSTPAQVQLHCDTRMRMDEIAALIIDAWATPTDAPMHGQPLMVKDDRGTIVFFPHEILTLRCFAAPQVATAPGMGQLMDFRT